jgi:dienelactone hydrolase
MKILKGIGLFLGAIFAYLIIVIFAPGFDVPQQPMLKRPSKNKKSPKSRKNVAFSVDGTTIRAWLYLPENVSHPVPGVVMNHGFGGTKDFLLERYALRFVEAGFAVLTYDYRHFGESDGQPRQLFSINHQLDDLRAAIDFAHSQPEINPNQIVLWGTSAAGGYGIAAAAEDERITAVISQCAGLDPEKDGKIYLKRAGIGHFLQLFMHAQRDKGRSRFDLSPHIIPMAGKPGTLAMHNAPGVFEGYARMSAESATFVNEICARALLMPHDYDPIASAKQVNCPALLLVCEQDNLVAPDSHVRVAEGLGDKAQIETYPIGHFDIYEGVHFETAVNEMISFIKKALKSGAN